MKLVYIAGPYTVGDTGGNVYNAITYAHKIIDNGSCPIVPHLSHFLHIFSPRPYDDWMKLDLAMLRKCDALLRLPGKSPGADKEVELAKALDIPVFTTFNELALWLKNTK